MSASESTTGGAPRWQLKPLQIAGMDESIEITDQPVTIGRAAQCEVAVSEGSFPYVSASHCTVRLLDGEPVVEDLGSKNGTLVNGAAVERSRLGNGDIIQLGAMGPRFAVVNAANLGDTLPTVALPATSKRQRGHELTQSALFKIKRALGMPRHADVDEMIRQGQRRRSRSALVALAVVALGAVGTLFVVERRSAAETQRLRELSDHLQERLGTAQGAADSVLAEQRVAWEAERQRLESESGRLSERLRKLEADAGASASTIAELRTRLGETNEKIERYNPIGLEQRRLREVRRVTRAVVFVETKTYLRDLESGNRLHVVRSKGGSPDFNLENRGEPFALESSGSGFSVRDGWILTNAHVVEPSIGSESARRLTERFAPETELAVVFSGKSRRHPAVVVRSVFEGDDDMALIKIEPFEAMPVTGDIDTGLPVPEFNEVVYVSGFPLGKMALQAGDVVIASTFRGILSRAVGSYLQVDAAVHRGNSGGPVIDERGRIIGVVTRVQITPDGTVPTIGYIIPIGALAKVWPPPGDAAGAEAQSTQGR